MLSGDGQMDPAMWVAFGWNAAAWLMWGIGIFAFRVALERRRQRIEQNAALAALAGSPENFPFHPNPQHSPEPGNAY